MGDLGEKEMTCQTPITKTNLYFCNPTDKAVISMANSPMRYLFYINNSDFAKLRSNHPKMQANFQACQIYCPAQRGTGRH